jgi:hypothetical protein
MRNAHGRSITPCKCHWILRETFLPLDQQDATDVKSGLVIMKLLMNIVAFDAQTWDLFPAAPESAFIYQWILIFLSKPWKF